MATFTYALSKDGLLLDVLVGIDPVEASLLAQQGLSPPGELLLRATIDTGCSATAIAPHVLRALNARVAPFHGLSTTAGGPTVVPMAYVSLRIPPLPGVAGTPLTPLPIVVSELAVPLDVDALIGLDILRQMILHLDGPADFFTLSH